MAELTEEQVRDRFLEHIWIMIRYWEREPRARTTIDKLKGLAFSILVTIDGEAADLPGFLLAPSGHPDDELYHRNEGEDWFPYNSPEQVRGEIGGSLHELFYDVGRRLGYESPIENQE